MARKRKAIHGHAAHIHGDKAPVSKRQKVDWSTIDDFKGFTITAADTKPYKKPVASKNNKTGAEVKTPKYPGQDAPLDANVVQQNPFPETKLSTVHVKISPALHWESTTRYRKFTINSEEFQVNQLVFVKNGEDSDGANPPHAVEGWLAKILEIRAGDSSHVFLRVFWAYRPEDLPGGRQPHHGASEIIVSNHMDIIEPLTVQSLADVVHWNDDPDSLPLPADQLFFRQSYDVTKKSNPFSALNKYCIDKQPINPDELLVQCPHCSDWLHAHCLEQQAIRDICEKHKKRGRPSKRAKANSDDLAAKPSLDAKLSASDAGKTRLTITENPTSEDKTRQWDVDISCLVCGKVIETAEDALKPVDSSASPGVTEDTESENVTVATAAKDGPPQDTVKSDPDAAPTDPAKTNAPKKRGRPPGFTNQKRKRISTSPESKAVLPEAKCLKMMTAEEEENSAPDAAVSATTMQDSPKPTTTTKTTTTTTTATTPATSVLSDATKTTTPEPAPMPDSVFQSGVLSVKQLLWGA